MRPATTTVLFAADMAAKRIVQALLDARDADYLPQHQAVFIADIHGMPRIITKLFALPRLRKCSYDILLIEDADVGARFPRRDGEVTVLGLRDLRPVAVHYVRDVEALTRALEGGLASGPSWLPSRVDNSPNTRSKFARRFLRVSTRISEIGEDFRTC
jgi:hypothetical protein